VSATEPVTDAAATGIARLLRPQSVAIVGLSTDPSKHGARVLRHLRAVGYAGEIYGVHPRESSVNGVTVVPRVADLPVAVDAMVCAVPAAALPDALEQGAELGVGAAVIFTAGFAEAGEDGRARQRELTAVARRGGLRLLGPNSAGIIRPSSRVVLSFLTSLDRPPEQIRPGKVAVVTQSGGAGSFLVNRAAARGEGLAALVSTGNEADVTAESVVAALVDDDEVHAIALVLEAVRDGATFIAAVDAAHAAGKPVVVCKLGRSATGRDVMRTHTGALADERRVTEGVLDALGVTVAQTPAEMLDVAEVMARTRPPAGPRVGVVTHSGGNAVLLADLAEDVGLQLPPVPPPLVAELSEFIEHGAVGNPMDLGAIMSGPHRFAEVVSRATRGFDVVLAVSTPHPPAFTRVRGETLLALKDSAVPVVNLWLAGDLGEEGLALLRRGDAPVVTEPRAAVRALAGLIRLGERERERGQSQPARHAATSTLPRLEHGASPTEAHVKALLADWGVPVVPGMVAADRDSAVAEARRLGFPVVLKINATNLEHKTDAGGVRLDLRSEAEVATAYDEVTSAVATAVPDAKVAGVLIERFSPGVEVIVGVRHDQAFGPVVLVGLGGVLAEALDDVAVAPAPVAPEGVQRMLSRLRTSGVLRSARGAAAPDVDALTEIVATVSSRFCEHADQIDELEINPLVFGSDGWVAVDAVLRLR
jgi:acyl-CoA synthetase (NDP forming)